MVSVEPSTSGTGNVVYQAFDPIRKLQQIIHDENDQTIYSNIVQLSNYRGITQDVLTALMLYYIQRRRTQRLTCDFKVLAAFLARGINPDQEINVPGTPDSTISVISFLKTTLLRETTRTRTLSDDFISLLNIACQQKYFSKKEVRDIRKPTMHVRFDNVPPSFRELKQFIRTESDETILSSIKNPDPNHPELTKDQLASLMLLYIISKEKSRCNFDVLIAFLVRGINPDQKITLSAQHGDLKIPYTTNPVIWYLKDILAKQTGPGRDNCLKTATVLGYLSSTDLEDLYQKCPENYSETPDGFRTAQITLEMKVTLQQIKCSGKLSLKRLRDPVIKSDRFTDGIDAKRVANHIIAEQPLDRLRTLRQVFTPGNRLSRFMESSPSEIAKLRDALSTTIQDDTGEFILILAESKDYPDFINCCAQLIKAKEACLKHIDQAENRKKLIEEALTEDKPLHKFFMIQRGVRPTSGTRGSLKRLKEMRDHETNHLPSNSKSFTFWRTTSSLSSMPSQESLSATLDCPL